jgi:hypothetical protein
MVLGDFEIEFVEWLNPDGTRSERATQDNTEYANAVATPPDKEMNVSWRRI